MDAQRTYLPAAGRGWALPLYDPLVKLLGGDAARKVLIEQAALSPGLRILDIGCGTGTMAVMIKRLHPNVSVVGLDPDPAPGIKRSVKTCPSNSSKVFRTVSRTRMAPSIASFLPSCTTIFRRTRKGRPFVKCDAYSARVARFICSTFKAPTRIDKDGWRIGFTLANDSKTMLRAASLIY